MVGGGYYAYRVGDCQGKVMRGGYQLADDKSYLEHCLDKVLNASPLITQTMEYRNCQDAIRRAMDRMMAEAKEKYGDTLIVAATSEN